MKVEKSVKEKIYCDSCGNKLPDFHVSENEMKNFYFESEKGEGIQVTLMFETEWGYRWGTRKSRGSWHTKFKASDLCEKCHKKLLKKVHDHIETILKSK